MNVLIFAGTTEGRKLAEELAGRGIDVTVCVATRYGGTLIGERDRVNVVSGRMDEGEIEQFLGSLCPQVVVDATHPYAEAVSENIRTACMNAGVRLLRLLRSSQEVAGADAVCVASVAEAVEYLRDKPGRILAATGVKELSLYTGLKDYKDRVVARVLSTKESVSIAGELGFEGKNLICMQGPFCEEINYAIMAQYNIKWLVTKESGAAGGFEQKIHAAQRAGARAVIVGRPVKEDGLSYEEVLSAVLKMAGADKNKPVPVTEKKVYLISAGPGSEAELTRRAERALAGSDVIIGASRIVNDLAWAGKPVFVSYDSQKIAEYISQSDLRTFSAVYSGDASFYSGAKGLLAALEGTSVITEIIPGVGSLGFFASRLGFSWEEAAIASLHGRDCNIEFLVKNNRLVFALLGAAGSVNTLCGRLLEAGLGSVKLYIGEDLSYENERITSGSPEELINGSFSPLSCAFIVNETPDGRIVTPGIPDECFIRGKVPMTKSEVRVQSLSALKLKEDSIIYDIGCGTGSVTAEAALLSYKGRVIAIDNDPEATELTRQNCRKLGAGNVDIICGTAPEAIRQDIVPTHAFIGGSGRKLGEIVKRLAAVSDGIRIVINAASLETVSEAWALIKEHEPEDVYVSQISATRGRNLAGYEMMTALNPVYIFAFTISGDDHA